MCTLLAVLNYSLGLASAGLDQRKFGASIRQKMAEEDEGRGKQPGRISTYKGGAIMFVSN